MPSGCSSTNCLWEPMEIYVRASICTAIRWMEHYLWLTCSGWRWKELRLAGWVVLPRGAGTYLSYMRMEEVAVGKEVPASRP